MNKNRKIKRGFTTSVAVGMSVMLCAIPVCAAEENGASSGNVYKEETVYVNADAAGTQKNVTVSNWLKNVGNSGTLNDESSLSGIKNLKGEETYSTDGNKLTWETDGKDIYYQGTTEQALPVSMKFTYYLDGQEMKPEDLKGKSGHLTIHIDYRNNTKKTVDINGKAEEMYSPFVMMTGLILPNETFSNVVIDNGKVISDGNKNIVFGFAMPGMQESLGVDSTLSDGTELSLPESLEISADVKDFTMSSTFTVALNDLLDDLNLEEIGDTDALKNAVDELEDAALQLVDGSAALSDGVVTLSDSYGEFDEGIQTLKDGIDVLSGGAGDLSAGITSYTDGVDQLGGGIRQYLGENGELTVKVTEYVNGVNTVVQGVKDYADGANTLADGVTSYIEGEQKLAEGAGSLGELGDGLTQVKAAISQLKEATDGEGATTEDLKAASDALADATEKLAEALDSDQITALLKEMDDLMVNGQEIMAQTEGMASELQSGIGTPVANIGAALTQLQTELNTFQTSMNAIMGQCTQAVAGLNQIIAADNGQIQTARDAGTDSEAAIQASIAALQQEQIKYDPASKEYATIGESIVALQAAADSTDGLENLTDLQTLPPVDISQIDLTGIKDCTKTILTNAQTFSAAAGKLQQTMTELQPKVEAELEAAQKLQEKLPEGGIGTVTDKVQALNNGMQMLNGSIGTLSNGIGELDTATDAFPEAVSGIQSLQDGFTQLGSYNESLLSGAESLKAGSQTLVSGVGTLSDGTNALAGGLDTLGGQMNAGAYQLTSNSQALRDGAAELLAGTKTLSDGGVTLKAGSTQVKDGIAQLNDGAKTLKDGAAQFEEEGTGKLKSTVEEELGDVLDRLDTLASGALEYDTFSGKSGAMDGNVKFVIETDPIE